MTAPDDISTGMYVAVVSERKDGWDFHPLFGYLRAARPRYTGEPYRVAAVSLPFIAVEDIDGNRFSLDVREVGVQKLNRRYVRAMAGDEGQDDRATPPRPGNRQRIELRCPRCGGTFAQRITPRHADWRQTCRNCGYQP